MTIASDAATDEDFVFCPVCRTIAPELGPGPGGRPLASCVHCGSLERHRVMALLLGTLVGTVPANSTILDVAPTKFMAEALKATATGPYLSVDFDPAADGRLVDVQASITAIPVRPETVGLLICSHVMEHVADDAAAASEIRRVLDPDGLALIQVPRRLGVPTEEDPSASPEDRIRRFGQADHVRYYGDDFEERLENAGLTVLSTSYTRILPLPLLRLIGADKAEELWVATAGADPRRFLDPQSVTRTLAKALMGSQALERELDVARTEAANWQSRYLWLHNRPAIRMASAGKRQVKRLVGAFKTL